jgi:hypothetical protein
LRCRGGYVPKCTFQGGGLPLFIDSKSKNELRGRFLETAKSALGQKQTYALQQAMSALHPIATAKADMPQW